MSRVEKTSKFADFARRARNGGQFNGGLEVRQRLLNEEEDNENNNVATNESHLYPDLLYQWKNGKLNQKTELLPEEKRHSARMACVVTTATNTHKAKEKFKEKVTLRKKLKDQMKKIAEERLTVKQIFKRYVESSTLHGFRYTCSDTYFIRRAIWAIMMVLGAIYFIVKLKEGIIEYLEYPFSTLSTIEYVRTLKFPAISFCLVNQYRLSKLKNSPNFYRLYKNGRLPFEKNWSDPGFDIDGETLVDEIRKTSFSVNETYLSCEYIKVDTENPDLPSRNCTHENYTSYFSEGANQCFTLHHIDSNYTMEIQNEGLKYAYEVIFDLKNADAMIRYDYTGMQVIIHDQNEPPVLQTGFFIYPGSRTLVRLNKIETHNLPPPYATKCGEVPLKYHKSYNQKSCMLEKITDYIGEKCNCREPFMPDNGLRYCSLKETLQCAYPHREQFNSYNIRGDCPVGCEVHSYSSSRSTAAFIHNPPTGIERRMEKQPHVAHFAKMQDKMNVTELKDYIEENIVVVLFYFGDMMKVINEQEATFDFYQFLGDMGGEIGLMLGASLLTFFEFVDLFGFLLYHQLLRLNKNKKEKKKSMREKIVIENRHSMHEDEIAI